MLRTAVWWLISIGLFSHAVQSHANIILNGIAPQAR